MNFSKHFELLKKNPEKMKKIQNVKRVLTLNSGLENLPQKVPFYFSGKLKITKICICIFVQVSASHKVRSSFNPRTSKSTFMTLPFTLITMIFDYFYCMCCIFLSLTKNRFKSDLLINLSHIVL